MSQVSQNQKTKIYKVVNPHNIDGGQSTSSVPITVQVKFDSKEILEALYEISQSLDLVASNPSKIEVTVPPAKVDVHVPQPTLEMMPNGDKPNVNVSFIPPSVKPSMSHFWIVGAIIISPLVDHLLNFTYKYFQH